MPTSPVVLNDDATAELNEWLARDAREQQKDNAIRAWHMSVFVATADTPYPIELPYTATDTYVYMNVYDPEDRSKVDEAATLARLKTVTQHVTHNTSAKLEKVYENSFELKVTINPDADRKIVIRYIADRETMCTRKVVGTRIVPAYSSPARVEEEVEWECESISLLAD